jgi:CHAT domain-containing protein
MLPPVSQTANATEEGDRAMERDQELRLLDLAESNPSAAIESADHVLAATADHRARAIAYRAKGVAFRTAGSLTESADAFEKGLEEARAHGDDSLIGRLELSLAPTLAYQGATDAALGMLVAAESRLDDGGRAQALTQRAGLVARTGDFAKSLELFTEAEPILVRHNDVRYLANLCTNRAIVYAYTGSFDAAEQDLHRARRIRLELGEQASAAELTHNLGFVAAQRGDIAEALRAYDQTEAEYSTLGMPLHELNLDRAQVLSLVGLVEDARSLTARVVAEMSDVENEVTRGEALIAHAAASWRAAHYDQAIDTARQAIEVLAGQERSGWQLRAEYLLAVAEFESGHRVPPGRLGTVSTELERAGQAFESLHARILSGRSALQEGDLAQAAIELEKAGSPDRDSPIDIRIQALLARALLRNSQGDISAASRAIGAGMKLLEDYRSSLGATESRVHVARLAENLIELGNRLAFTAGKPSRVLSWIDRSRASTLSLVSPKPPNDPELATALTALRRAQADRHEAELEGAGGPGLLREQARLEERVRRVALRQTAVRATRRPSVSLAELKERIGTRTMLVYGVVDGDLHGIRVRGRSITMRHLGSIAQVERESRHLGSALRSLARRPDAPNVETSISLASHALERLDTHLLKPFNLKDEEVIVVPTPSLQSLPWGALPSVDGRTVTVSTSPSTWFHNQDDEQHRQSVALIAGPRLEHAEAEIDRLAAIYPEARLLTGSEATVDRALEAMNASSVTHFACHAAFRADNAMFSSLHLVDGDLTVYDIEQLSSAPQTVVLSACESGLSQNAAGEELAGLATALVSMGTRSLVVSVAPVPDAIATIQLMDLFHQGLSEGAAPPHALATARSEFRDESVAARVARNVFVSIG